MRKRNSRRRFDEPRCGVSQLMVEAESKELNRELESYLLESINELKEKSEARLRTYRQSDQSLHAALNRLPERERLAISCMLGRDLFLLLAVYLDFLGLHQSEAMAPIPNMGSASVSDFSEWLFGGE